MFKVTSKGLGKDGDSAPDLGVAGRLHKNFGRISSNIARSPMWAIKKKISNKMPSFTKSARAQSKVINSKGERVGVGKRGGQEGKESADFGKGDEE